MEEYTPIAPVIFEYNGKIYKYDFNEITVEQAELTREIGEFKHNQVQAGTSNFRDAVKSRGVEWLSIAMSYLLREVKNGVTLSFNKDKAEKDTEAFVKSLPVSYLEQLKECVADFFHNTGKSHLILTTLRNERKQNAVEMLLPILTRIMPINERQGDL
jgi:hypothetical protein